MGLEGRGKELCFICGPSPGIVNRRYRLTSRTDFQKVYTKGHAIASKVAVVYVLPQSKGDGTRVGFAAGKKLGSAVVRNRLKRRMREIVRHLWPHLRAGVFIVVIARHACKEMAYSQLVEKMAELFRRAGLLRL